MLSHVLLPESLSIKLAFVHYGMLTVADETAFGTKALRATADVKLAESEINDRRIRLSAGAHAPDDINDEGHVNAVGENLERRKSEVEASGRASGTSCSAGWLDRVV